MATTTGEDVTSVGPASRIQRGRLARGRGTCSSRRDGEHDDGAHDDDEGQGKNTRSSRNGIGHMRKGIIINFGKKHRRKQDGDEKHEAGYE